MYLILKKIEIIPIANKQEDNLYLNLACLGVYLFVCLFVSNNVKTAESIRPKFCVGPHVAVEKVYGQSGFKYIILKYFYLKLFNFVKF